MISTFSKNFSVFQFIHTCVLFQSWMIKVIMIIKDIDKVVSLLVSIFCFLFYTLIKIILVKIFYIHTEQAADFLENASMNSTATNVHCCCVNS